MPLTGNYIPVRNSLINVFRHIYEKTEEFFVHCNEKSLHDRVIRWYNGTTVIWIVVCRMEVRAAAVCSFWRCPEAVRWTRLILTTFMVYVECEFIKLIPTLLISGVLARCPYLSHIRPWPGILGKFIHPAFETVIRNYLADSLSWMNIFHTLTTLWTSGYFMLTHNGSQT